MSVVLLLGGLALLLLLSVPPLRRGLARLCHLGFRSLVALGALAAMKAAGAGAVGLALGVNLFNALTLGLLGLPGLGLLWMLHWITNT